MLYCPFGVTFPLAQDRQGAQVGYPFPLVNLGALGETVDLFSGASLVSCSSQQRFDLMTKVEAVQRIEGGPALVCPLGVGVSLLPVLREGCHFAQSVGGPRLVQRPQRPAQL